MSNSFHNKFHRKNHQSYKSGTMPDAGWDPIASVESPWQGDFVLSASNDPDVSGKTLESNEASLYANINDANKVCINLNADNIAMIGGTPTGDNCVAIGPYAQANSNSFVYAPIALNIPTSANLNNDTAIFDTNGIYLRGNSDVVMTSGTIGSPRGLVFKTDNTFDSVNNDMRAIIETDAVSGNYIGIKDFNSPSWVGTTKIYNDGISVDNLTITTRNFNIPSETIVTDMVANSSITIPKLAFPLETLLGVGLTPVGTIIQSFRTDTPGGYLKADGAIYNESEHPILYEMIGSGSTYKLSAVECTSNAFTEYNNILTANDNNCGLFGIYRAGSQFRVPSINNLYLNANGDGRMGEIDKGINGIDYTSPVYGGNTVYTYDDYVSRVYTASGSNTFTCPSGIDDFQVACVGGGGGTNFGGTVTKNFSAVKQTWPLFVGDKYGGNSWFTDATAPSGLSAVGGSCLGGAKRFAEYHNGSLTCYGEDGHNLVWIDQNNNVRCIGYNYESKFGQGMDGTALVAPGATLTIEDGDIDDFITKVYVSNRNLCVLTDNGYVYFTGDNTYQQCSFIEATADANNTFYLKKSTLTNITKVVVSVRSTGNSFYFLDVNGNLWSSGYNAYGQLGDGTTISTNAKASKVALKVLGPTATGSGLLTGGKYVVDVVTGENDYGCVLALISDGTVRTVGYNANYELGDNTTVTKSSWVTPNISNVQEIQCCSTNTQTTFIVKKTNGDLWGWGSNDNGVLGTGNVVSVRVPTLIPTATSVSNYWLVGHTGTLFVLKNNNIYSCGNYNTHGGLGVGDFSVRLVLTQLTAGDLIDNLIAYPDMRILGFSVMGNAGGPYASYCITTEGVYACGYGYHGELSLGDLGTRTTFRRCRLNDNLKLKGDISKNNPIFSTGFNSFLGGTMHIIDSMGRIHGCGISNYGSVGVDMSTDRTSLSPIDHLNSGLTNEHVIRTIEDFTGGNWDSLSSTLAGNAGATGLVVIRHKNLSLHKPSGKIYSYVCVQNTSDIDVVKSFNPIGTVLYTTRTDLPVGFKWADGSEFTGADYPDFYSKLTNGYLPSVSFSTWNTYDSTNGGNVGYYGLNSGTGKFKMIKFTDTFMRSTTATGNVGAYQDDEFESHSHLCIGGSSGTGATGWDMETGVTQTRNDYTENSGGTETRPKNISLRAMVQVFNTVDELSEAQWTAMETDLSGKADRDLGNLSSTHSVSSFVIGVSGMATGPDFVIETWHGVGNTDWYRLYNSGWKEQGGKTPISTSAGTTTFIIPFSTTPCINLTPFLNSGYVLCYKDVVRNPTNTDFDWNWGYRNGTTIATGDFLWWCARGY